MSQLEQKLEIRSEPLEDYPWHLPDMPIPTGPYISYEEFFDWADEDTLAEWVDGRIEMSSPVSANHEELVSFLGDLFRTYTKMLQLGRVLQNPFQMKLPGKIGSGREPDVMFVAKANLGRLESGLLRGPADLVVEIISPESQWRDRHEKFQEYAAGGVSEYWLIDPTQNQAEFYHLNPKGLYKRQALNKEGRFYSQAMVGFWLKPEWLWRKPLPDTVLVLKTVAGPDYQAYLTQQLESPEEL